jgi:hypothetical protein
MPMRGELVIPATQSQSGWELSRSTQKLLDQGVLPVVCFCLIGLFLTFALSAIGFDQLPLLMAQYDLFG